MPFDESVCAMAYRTAARDDDDRPTLDLGFLRTTLAWMLIPWLVVGLTAWAVRAG
jgi:hypothetical protein